MKILDFLQWLGVGGVALISLYYSQRNSNRTSEQDLIKQMKIQLDSSDARYDKLAERVDNLEDINMKLREENLNITHERNQLLISKQNMEKELVDKIESLVKENQELKREIARLESELSKK